MATTSTSALFTRSLWLSKAVGTPKSLLAASADSRRLVDSAVISKSSASDLNAGMCACAAHPRSGLAPMMPTRIRLAPPLLIRSRDFLHTLAFSTFGGQRLHGLGKAGADLLVDQPACLEAGVGMGDEQLE